MKLSQAKSKCLNGTWVEFYLRLVSITQRILIFQHYIDKWEEIWRQSIGMQPARLTGPAGCILWHRASERMRRRRYRSFAIHWLALCVSQPPVCSWYRKAVTNAEAKLEVRTQRACATHSALAARRNGREAKKLAERFISRAEAIWPDCERWRLLCALIPWLGVMTRR
jgi:hypothetical protein